MVDPPLLALKHYMYEYIKQQVISFNRLILRRNLSVRIRHSVWFLKELFFLSKVPYIRKTLKYRDWPGQFPDTNYIKWFSYNECCKVKLISRKTGPSLGTMASSAVANASFVPPVFGSLQTSMTSDFRSQVCNTIRFQMLHVRGRSTGAKLNIRIVIKEDHEICVAENVELWHDFPWDTGLCEHLSARLLTKPVRSEPGPD
ncbi:hypothetical protein J6590_053912 [Homalodisca vitripennis]|nr:hypothetical protein J6590_053912 [Homalodisca vitripennis]